MRRIAVLWVWGEADGETAQALRGVNGGCGWLTSGAIVAVVHVVASHRYPTSPPQTARMSIAHAEPAQDVGSLVAENFAR
jgi:hypothetical protein